MHQELLKGKALAIACPKLDDTAPYVEKLANIFRANNTPRVTVAIMEVPCCHSMLQIIRQAYDAVKPDLPVRQVVISTRGEIKTETAW